MIVDCAPTGETLRLLSFPDVATWWLEKVFPWERGMAAARPFARTLLDMPLPGDAVFDDVERLARNLVAMNGILRDRSRTSIRLVMNPDRMVVKEAMRTFTYLNLYGYLTDAVVVNRVLPEEAGEGYFAAWRERPAGADGAGALGVLAGADPRPRRTSTQEVMGAEMLDRLGERGVRRQRPGRACCTRSWRRSSSTDNGSATLRAAAARSPRGATSS